MRKTRSIRALAAATATAAVLAVATLAPQGEVQAAAPDACGEVRLKADGTAWTCTFADDFNPLSVLEPGKNGLRAHWVQHDTRLTRFFAGSSCFDDTTNQVQATQGTLKLKTTRALTAFKCVYGPQAGDYFMTRYKAGAIGTGQNFKQTYGAFETRMKLPLARVSGMHGGFWSTPPDLSYGAWPSSGEIDTMEWWSSVAGKANHYLHYDGERPYAWTWDPVTQQPVFGYGPDAGDCTIAPAGWHTYRLEWTPTEMRFFVDGAQCDDTVDWDSSQYDHDGAPFDRPFSVNLMMFTEPVEKIDASLTFPQVLEVDYVKVWR